MKNVLKVATLALLGCTFIGGETQGMNNFLSRKSVDQLKSEIRMFAKNKDAVAVREAEIARREMLAQTAAQNQQPPAQNQQPPAQNQQPPAQPPVQPAVKPAQPQVTAVKASATALHNASGDSKLKKVCVWLRKVVASADEQTDFKLVQASCLVGARKECPSLESDYPCVAAVLKAMQKVKEGVSKDQLPSVTFKLDGNVIAGLKGLLSDVDACQGH